MDFTPLRALQRQPTTLPNPGDKAQRQCRNEMLSDVTDVRKTTPDTAGRKHPKQTVRDAVAICPY